MIFRIFLIFLVFLASVKAQAADPIWGENVVLPTNGRPNPLNVETAKLPGTILAGRIHALIYPVSITGILPPLAPIRHFLDGDTQNPLKRWFEQTVDGFVGIHSFNDALAMVGLHDYPATEGQGVYSVPFPGGRRPNYPMGFGAIDSPHGRGFSFSCAACHSANLFGKRVLGMTNRFPRANETFLRAKEVAPFVDAQWFKFDNASDGEIELFQRMQINLKSVGVKMPLVLGLDTSLAQVALSLNHRAEDEYASKDALAETFPRGDYLDSHPADSKPAVWWNLKYKNRWLSDGSVLSGNPIVTNLLWNEIGRGSDLHELEAWIDSNEDKIKELTTAVFSAEAPKFTDFFAVENADLAKAKQGEKIFLAHCAGCHGTYEKGWSLPRATSLSLVEQFKTVAVHYKTKTPVINVGTDPSRYLGMKSLEEKLNPLAISQRFGVVIKAQKGYVPPPLVGIWARWPYFHNNSAPSLCAVLTRAEDRPSSYFAGEANDKNTDFDRDCNGYPSDAPAEWQQQKFLYDTSREGLHNSGHDEGIFLKNGVEILSSDDKKALIAFLQSL